VNHQHRSNDIITISNILTCLRIGLIPSIVLNMLAQQWSQAFVLFTVAAFTDILDGFCARYFQQETILGSYLDPLADKLLFIACYTALLYSTSSEIPVFFVFFVLIKELILILASFYLGLVRKIIIIKPTFMGKFTTFIQTCFLWYIFIAQTHIYSSRMCAQLFVIIIVACMALALGEYGYLGYKQWRQHA
jgi:cardiolipin synthase (CMP-forming)